ncbi:MAG: hypothetical protein VKN13_05255 [Cyanobacteriota bacterium]|nr:hypothetical protein [Cyanobacteriota bacterium]
MPDLRRGSQSPRDQLTEVHVLVLLGSIRIAMLWFAGALDQLQRGEGPPSVSFAQMATAGRGPAVAIVLVVALLLYGQTLRRRPIPARLLDVLGLWVVFSLIVHFVKINLLMLSDVISPALLLGQILTYLLFFVFGWGWLFWRLDQQAGPADQRILQLPVSSRSQGSFDYYYGSLMALLAGKISTFQGVTRLGKMMVAIHSFMLLDLTVIALARFYQLVQKTI